jgi:hypothetical protein
MNNDTIVFSAALNALLIKRYEKMTSLFDEVVIQKCIDDAKKIAALAQGSIKEDKIIILPSLETKKPRGRRPKAKS